MTPATDTPLPLLTRHDGVLAWDVPPGWSAISSASVGGGLLRPRWVLNASVGEGFTRRDLGAWAGEVATSLHLEGAGCALLTAADVGQVQHAHRDGVSAWATVGVTKPTWPHDERVGSPDDARAVLSRHNGRQGDRYVTTEPHDPPAPGTVNIVVALPVPLTASALVQAVGTVTEAKAQVLVGSGVPGTGTASDAVVVLCPGSHERAHAEVPFAGVRSLWGRRIAHAVHDAVADGLTAHPWTAQAAGTDGERVPVW